MTFTKDPSFIKSPCTTDKTSSCKVTRLKTQSFAGENKTKAPVTLKQAHKESHSQQNILLIPISSVTHFKNLTFFSQTARKAGERVPLCPIGWNLCQAMIRQVKKAQQFFSRKASERVPLCPIGWNLHYAYYPVCI